MTTWLFLHLRLLSVLSCFAAVKLKQYILIHIHKLHTSGIHTHMHTHTHIHRRVCAVNGVFDWSRMTVGIHAGLPLLKSAVRLTVCRSADIPAHLSDLQCVCVRQHLH